MENQTVAHMLNPLNILINISQDLRSQPEYKDTSLSGPRKHKNSLKTFKFLLFFFDRYFPITLLISEGLTACTCRCYSRTLSNQTLPPSGWLWDWAGPVKPKAEKPAFLSPWWAGNNHLLGSSPSHSCILPWPADNELLELQQKHTAMGEHFAFPQFFIIKFSK